MKQLMAQYFLLLSGKRPMKGDLTLGASHSLIFDDSLLLWRKGEYLLQVGDIDGLPSDIEIWDMYVYAGIKDLSNQGFDIVSGGPINIRQGGITVAAISGSEMAIPKAGSIAVQNGKLISTPAIGTDTIAEKTAGHGVTINSCGSIYMNYQEGHFWDSGDYIHFDRANNRYLFRLANQIVAYVDVNGFHNGAPP